MKDNWAEEHPDPPLNKPSDWYFFVFQDETDVSIIEVYPERKYWPEGLWGSRVKNVPESPLKPKEKKPIVIKKTKKKVDKPKRKRGRPKKKKD